MKKVRIFFLRLLISWWVIVFMTISLLPVAIVGWLITGLTGGVQAYKEMVAMIWNGV
jgi:hypothetical protein